MSLYHTFYTYFYTCEDTSNLLPSQRRLVVGIMVVEDGPGYAHERTHLLSPHTQGLDAELGRNGDTETASHITSMLSKEEQALSGTSIGERLPYNDYTTVDWLHELVNVL